MSQLVDVASRAGFRLVAVPELDQKLRLERERFSGGYYVGAKERNEERRRKHNCVYVDHVNQVIYGRSALIAKMITALPEPTPPPVRDPDDVIDDLYAEQQDLNKAHPRYKEYYAELDARIFAAETKRAAEMDAYFKARNPMPSREELDHLFARIDAALGNRPWPRRRGPVKKAMSP